jgi:hypothetical protein
MRKSVTTGHESTKMDERGHQSLRVPGYVSAAIFPESTKMLERDQRSRECQSN